MRACCWKFGVGWRGRARVETGLCAKLAGDIVRRWRRAAHLGWAAVFGAPGRVWRQRAGRGCVVDVRGGMADVRGGVVDVRWGVVDGALGCRWVDPRASN